MRLFVGSSLTPLSGRGRQSQLPQACSCAHMQGSNSGSRYTPNNIDSTNTETAGAIYNVEATWISQRLMIGTIYPAEATKCSQGCHEYCHHPTSAHGHSGEINWAADTQELKIASGAHFSVLRAWRRLMPCSISRSRAIVISCAIYRE